MSGKKRTPTSHSNFCTSTSSNVGKPPTSIQLHRIPSSFSSLVSTVASSSFSESSAHKIRMKIHLVKEWLKNIHRIIIIMRVREMGSILPELCTIASLLSLTTTLPSGSSSSLMSPTISQFCQLLRLQFILGKEKENKVKKSGKT